MTLNIIIILNSNKSNINMLLNKSFVLCLIIYGITADTEFILNMLNKNSSSVNITDNSQLRQELIKVQVYYECMCPYCVQFFKQQLATTVHNLGPYLDVHIYPHGNAQTYENNGKYEFKCQHGPVECYGNKIHACAVDKIGNITKAIYFNTCMMAQSTQGLHDINADICGNYMKIDVKSIKECAKHDRGNQLLKHYGEESKKADFKHVPYILVNNKTSDRSRFIYDVCNAIKNPTKFCQILAIFD